MMEPLHQEIAGGYEVRPATNGGWIVLSPHEAPGRLRTPIAAFTGYGDLIQWLDTMHDQLENSYAEVVLNEQVHTDA